MRPVLALSLVCLALTLALNYAPALFPGASGEGRLADRALDVLVGAKGPLLPAARVDANERMGEVIRLGDRTLVGAGQSGLRAAFLGRGFELRAERCFDVARSEADARALREAVDAAEPGAVVVLASSGRLEPEDGAAPAELTRALAELGARARPGSATPESWAFLAARLERGWVPLAEAYSRDSGVALAFTLSSDLESYAQHRGELALVRAPARGEITLEDELAHADERAGRVELANGTVLGRPLAGMLFAPRAHEPARVVWRDVAIGPGSGFVAWLGLADGASTGSDGVDFALRVDGELVHSQRVVAGAPWKVVQVDLRRFAGKRVTLELAADAGTSDAGDVALVGRPLLVYGYDRSPLEALAGER